DEVIAKIDTEGTEAISPLTVSRLPKAFPARGRPPGGIRAPTPMPASAGVAMPAAAKLMADNRIPLGSVPGTGKDGRITKGDVLGAIEAGTKPVAMTPPVVAAAPKAALPTVSAPP